MKSITLFLFLSMTVCLKISAQQIAPSQVRLSYTYDKAGNRISRRVITLSMQRQSTDSIPKQEETVSSSLLTCKVVVYPNPTEGEINLSISNSTEESTSEITVYNNSGQLLITLQGKGNTTIPIDLSPYNNGIYLINFQQGESKSFYKIIKK